MSESNEIDYSALRSVALVIFEKMDGTIREMVCTSNLDIVPSSQHPKGVRTNLPDYIVRVFDLQKEDWRSFNRASVLSIRKLR
jgi:hypothetical protein